MKLFLDANIIFTAAYTPQGASGFLFSIAEAGAITLCTSLYALDEAKRNLALKAVKKLLTMGALPNNRFRTAAREGCMGSSSSAS